MHECKQEGVLAMMDKKLEKIDKKLDDALRFKHTVLGVVAGISSLTALVFALLKIR